MDFTEVSSVQQESVPAISASQVRSFLGCRRAWAFEKAGYGRGFKKYFITGTLVHAGIESYYLNRDFREDIVEVSKLMKKEHPEYLNVIEEEVDFAIALVLNYIDFAKDNDNFEIVSLEETYIFEDATMKVKFILDALVKDKLTGDYYIMEHKTPKTFAKESLKVDTQATLYVALAELTLGIPIAGIIYNQVKKKLPRKPEPLVKGGISSAAIDTTPEIYRQALIDYYGSVDAAPAPQKSRLASLMADGERFIKRDILLKTPEEKQEVVERFRRMYKEMMSFRDEVSYDNWPTDLNALQEGIKKCTPNPTIMNCGSCAFLVMCEMSNKGVALPAPPEKKKITLEEGNKATELLLAQIEENEEGEE